MSGSTIWRYVTPGYFAAFGIPVKRRPGLSDLTASLRLHVILSESLAATLYGDREPNRRAVHGWPGWWWAWQAMPGTLDLDSATEPEFYVNSTNLPGRNLQRQKRRRSC